MFNVGLPEILMVVLVTFVVAPREIPKVMRKIGQLVAALNRMRDEIVGLERDVQDIIREGLPDDKQPVRKPEESAPADGSAAGAPEERERSQASPEGPPVSS